MAEATATQGQGITRREFLNYVWGAAISLFLAEFGIGVYLFSLPRFREGEFGSDFDLGALSEILPPVDGAPGSFPDAKTWLLNIGPEEAAKGQGQQGLMAIYKVCTHLGCLYKFEPSTDRFECPCHGSKFHLDGTKILEEGPAPRGLDRFVVELRDAAGNVVAKTNEQTGEPLPLPADTSGVRVVVKTGQKILGGPPKSDRA
ncbi:MAG TPA: Rieske 2Fe-2S domain-containing protein [Anaerolineae bacterium]|nr:Rieske 2Fe-2S domain-containing protein [Anaerolineae bacterium]